VVLVKKKDGSWRYCIDFRKINAITKQDRYPLPRIDDAIDTLKDMVYLSKFDLTQGYWQIPLTEDAKTKTAFRVRSGAYEYNVLPMGITNAEIRHVENPNDLQVVHVQRLKRAILRIGDTIANAEKEETQNKNKQTKDKGKEKVDKSKEEKEELMKKRKHKDEGKFISNKRGRKIRDVESNI